MRKNLLLFATTWFLLLTALFFSCKKTDGPATNPAVATNNVYDPAALVSSSISAFVTDESGAAVSGATVTVGTTTATTDSRGFVRVMNAQVVKSAGVVTVDKAGYFKAIKTWIAQQGKEKFLRIKMLTKATAGTVNGATGGTVNVTGGMKIIFPANALVNASTGLAYTGTVTVFARSLDPTSLNFNETMPGDARALASNGQLSLLGMYALSAVELRGAASELLQIAPGKKANLTMPIPTTLQGNAPSNLPLYYFDETKGLWKEEGTSVKSGTDYVGDVSHFSYWSNPYSMPYVQLDLAVTDVGGNPVPDAFVRFKRITQFGWDGYVRGYTDATGIAVGPVPANSQLGLDILASSACQSLYTTTFSTGNVGLSLGTISLLSNRTFRVYGTATGCNGPLTNGIVMVTSTNGIAVPVDNNTGAYSVSLLVCSGTAATVTSVAALDAANAVQSAPIVTAYVPGSSNLVNLQACGTSTNEFLTYSFSNNTSQSFNSTQDSLYQKPSNQTPSSMYAIRGRHGTAIPSDILFSNVGLVVGGTYPIYVISDNQVNAQLSNVSASVNITEFGPAVTGFIAGTISGTFTTPATGTLNVNGSFRVRRKY